MPTDHHARLVNLLARINQDTAELEALTAGTGHDEMRRLAAELREIQDTMREDVETKLRAGNA